MHHSEDFSEFMEEVVVLLAKTLTVLAFVFSAATVCINVNLFPSLVRVPCVLHVIALGVSFIARESAYTESVTLVRLNAIMAGLWLLLIVTR